MSGIANVNVNDPARNQLIDAQNLDNFNVENQVNQPVVNNQPGIVNQDEVQAQIANLEVEQQPVQENDGYVPTMTMSKKIAELDRQVNLVVNGHSNMDLNDLFILSSSYSEVNDQGEKTIYKNVNDAKCLDREVAKHIRALLNNKCLSKFPQVQIQEAKVHNDRIDALINQVLSGSYDLSRAQEFIENELSQQINNYRDYINQQDDNTVAADQKNSATAFLNQLKEKLSNMVMNQLEVKNQLEYLNTLDDQTVGKITILNPTDLIGMSGVFQSDETKISKIFDIPKDNLEEIQTKIQLGEMTVKTAIENNPHLQVGLTALSGTNRQGLMPQLDELVQQYDHAIEEFQNLKDELQVLENNGQGQTQNAQDLRQKINVLMSKAMDRLSNLSSLKSDADNQLTDHDSNLLFTKEHSYDSYKTLVKRELLLLKLQLGMGNQVAQDNINRLLSDDNMPFTLNLLKGINFNFDVFKNLVNDNSVIQKSVAIMSGQLSNEVLMNNLREISAKVTSGDLHSENTLFNTVVGAIPQDHLSENARFTMDHLSVTLNLLSDAQNCINYVMYGNNIPDPVPNTSNIRFQSLKDAFKAVCHPSAALINFLKSQHYEADLMNVEAVILRAAYHLYLAQHPGDENKTKPFAENLDFLQEMGIVAGNHVGMNEVSISRYNNFDPINVNLKSTDMSYFLKGFNLMVHNSSFIESCKKIPAVHVAERFAEALSVNLPAILQNNPALANQFNQLQTAKEKLDWMNDHIQLLAENFVQSNAQTIARLTRDSNLTQQQDVMAVLNNLKIQDLIDFADEKQKVLGGNNNVTNVNDLLGNIPRFKGSTDLAMLGNLINNVTTYSITQAIPDGQTFLGLKAEDFQNPNRIGQIEEALRNATDKSSDTYALAVIRYAKLITYPRDKLFSLNILETRELTDNDLDLALSNLNLNTNGQQIDGDLVNVQITIKDKCNNILTANKNSMTPYGRMRILQNLKISSSMFEPENNIFVKNSAEGKAKYNAIKQAIDEAVKLLNDRKKDFSTILKDLQSKVNAQLAGNKTAQICHSVLALAPYIQQEVEGQDTRKSNEDIFRSKLKGLFNGKSGTRLDEARRALLLSTSVSLSSDSRRLQSTLHNLKTKEIDNVDLAANLVENNPLCGLMVEHALRKVAYDNGFETYADMQYAMASNEGSGKKSKSELIDEAVVELKKSFNVDNSVLKKMILHGTSSDIFMQSNDGNGFSERIRYFGRAVRSSSLSGFFRDIGRSIKNKFTTFKNSRTEAANIQHITDNALLTLKEGQSLIHTSNNDVVIGVGIGVGNFFKRPLNLSAGLSAGDDSKFAVTRKPNGVYTFQFSAGFALGFEAAASLGVSANLNFNGGKAGGMSVDFSNFDEASAFFSKLMVASLQSEDFTNGSNLKRTVNNRINVSGGVGIDVMDFNRQVHGEDRQFDPYKISASINGGYNREKGHQITPNSHVYSRHSVRKFSVGVKASFSALNMLNLRRDTADLKGEELEAYKENLELNNKIDYVLGILFNRKGLLDKFATKEFIDKIADNPLDLNGKKKWAVTPSIDRYKQDPNRCLGELIRDIGMSTVVSPALKDVDSLQDYLASKIPGVTQIADLKKRLADFSDRLKSVFNTSNFRVNASLGTGGNSDDVVNANLGVTYTTDNAVSFETNLLQNRIIGANKTVKIMPETMGGTDNVNTHNIKFLSKSMKKLGFSEKQINQAVLKMEQLQQNGRSSLLDFKIVRNVKKDILKRIQQGIDAGKNYVEQFNKAVESLDDADYEPSKVVFHVKEASVDEHSFNFGAQYIAKLSISSSEKMMIENNYEVAF